MPKKKTSTVKKAVKKGGWGLFGKAARAGMGRKARIAKAVSGGKKRAKK